VAMARSLRGPAAGFTRATMIGVAALTAGLLQWMVAFLTVGAEWFLMWQSRLWNGQEAAARMFMVEGIVLLVLLAKEP
jgi:predicted small integral membrane protein